MKTALNIKKKNSVRSLPGHQCYREATFLGGSGSPEFREPTPVLTKLGRLQLQAKKKRHHQAPPAPYTKISHFSPFLDHNNLYKQKNKAFLFNVRYRCSRRRSSGAARKLAAHCSSTLTDTLLSVKNLTTERRTTIWVLTFRIGRYLDYKLDQDPYETARIQQMLIKKEQKCDIETNNFLYFFYLSSDFTSMYK